MFSHTSPHTFDFFTYLWHLATLVDPPAFESKFVGPKCHGKLFLAKNLGKSPLPLSFVKSLHYRKIITNSWAVRKNIKICWAVSEIIRFCWAVRKNITICWAISEIITFCWAVRKKVPFCIEIRKMLTKLGITSLGISSHGLWGFSY